MTVWKKPTTWYKHKNLGSYTQISFASKPCAPGKHGPYLPKTQKQIKIFDFRLTLLDHITFVVIIQKRNKFQKKKTKHDSLNNQ